MTLVTGIMLMTVGRSMNKRLFVNPPVISNTIHVGLTHQTTVTTLSLDVWKFLLESVEDKIKSNRFLGEFGPSRNKHTINLSEVSHRITNIEIDEYGDTYADIQILDTNKGQAAKNFIDNGMPVCLSPVIIISGRQNKEIDSESCRLIALDIVPLHTEDIDLNNLNIKNNLKHLGF